ncbi:hypothetical protein KP509_26G054200 [Ceratopteris richardii]|uniref:Uncharacterized protein n=1 Tax=Ceratopteris richardii TaxID=49495 RepID=A0A8T2RNT4_CERRI|nr:hypothetical protein KP509_26G054200 [Ceratopteris richardii]
MYVRNRFNCSGCPCFISIGLSQSLRLTRTTYCCLQTSNFEEKVLDLCLTEYEKAEKAKEEESDSKSSTDNLEAMSGEGDGGTRPVRKRYHRHTLHQIQEMERFFKEYPHPDEKQRQELSRELKLSPRQIKFWFQNKRTKLKVHHERHDNGVLRAENEKLKMENFALRDAVRNVSCPNCGGPATIAEMSYDEQKLRIENSRLREEIDRISALTAKYVGRQVQSMSLPTSCSPLSACGLGTSHVQLPVIPCGSDLPCISGFPIRSLMISEVDKPIVIELAMASLEELYEVAQAGEPLWLTDANGVEALQQEVYLERFRRGIGSAHSGLKLESSRHAGLVVMNSNSLVETFMDVNQWVEMFPFIISRAQTREVLSAGIAGTYDGAIQLMHAELHVPSPMVSTREVWFVRYSKRLDHLWVVVDVSVDSLLVSLPPASIHCQRRPSGCIIEEMPSGHSKVTWVEHAEVESCGVGSLFQHYVNVGLAFGAARWMCTLQRQCERIATVLASNNSSGDLSVLPSPEGRVSLLKLAERMTSSFCGGVSASTTHSWLTLAGTGIEADDVRVLVRKTVNVPGKPSGIVLCAATSLWLPLSPSKVFHFLRDERFRNQWDILSNSGFVEEVLNVEKGHDPDNTVSLLRVNPVSSTQNNMLILQECCTDASCSMVVYAPVDVAAMTTVLKGGDPDAVALLPSGFAILPDGSHHCSSIDLGGVALHEAASGGSLLTVMFQILVDRMSTARLSLDSVATVSNLICKTVACVKGALSK